MSETDTENRKTESAVARDRIFRATLVLAALIFVLLYKFLL
jgi:hypothetical protein